MHLLPQHFGSRLLGMRPALTVAGRPMLESRMMSVPLGGKSSWASWLTGKALPISICAVLAVAVGQGLLGDATAVIGTGVSVLTALGLLRRLLTLGFIVLIA